MDARRMALALLLAMAAPTGSARADELFGLVVQGVGNVLGAIFDDDGKRAAAQPAAQVQTIRPVAQVQPTRVSANRKAPANAVSRDQSKIVLAMPHLDGGRELYQFFGWDSSYSVETSYAAQFPKAGNYPRAQVYLKLLAPGRVWTVTRNINAEFLQRFVPFLKEKKITLVSTTGGGTDERRRFGRFDVENADCVWFADVSDFMIGANFGSPSTGGRATWNVTGIYCSAQGAKLSDADVAAVRSGYRITLNGATHSSSTAASAVTSTPPAHAAPADSPPDAGANASPTKIIGWSAASGTRFIAGKGYLQVVRRDANNVVTVNANNRTARWAFGLIPTHGRAIASGALDSLLPLAVNKSATFQETAANGDAWRYTVNVVGTETITVGSEAYDTFIVSVREQSLNADQGGLDLTRTMWVAPRAGGILRSRTTQAGGPPGRLPSWDVTKIEPGALAPTK